MTVCIAALCDRGATVLLAADQKVGMDFVEGELGSGKIRWIHRLWRAMIAGSDALPAFEIARRAKRRLDGFKNRIPQVSTIKRVISRSYDDVRTDRIVNRFLKSRGWTLREFKEQGRVALPESVFLEIDSQIRKYDLESDLLVCGFGQWRGEILHVSNPGEVTLHTDFGFHAIGTGDYAALSSLYQRAYDPDMPTAEALYYVYEAKLAAERASGVGHGTHVLLLRKSRDHGVYAAAEDFAMLEDIRENLKPRDLSREDRDVLKKLPVLHRLQGNE